jgi:hypothetical protein
MKVIRQTIRESVRKLPIPPIRTSSLSPNRSPVPGPHSPHQAVVSGGVGGEPGSMTMGHQHQHVSSPQLSTLVRRPKTPTGSSAGVSPGSVERHSMEMDEKVGTGMEYESRFRTRSKTIGDINEASLQDNATFTVGCGNSTDSSIACAHSATDSHHCSHHQCPSSSSKRGSPCSSVSNLSCSSHSGSSSAKLQYASSNPVHYSSNSVSSSAGGGGGGRGQGQGHHHTGGSPIWKPRSETVKLGVMQQTLVSSQEDAQSHCSVASKDSTDSSGGGSGSCSGDSGSVMSRTSQPQTTKTVVLQTFDNHPVIKDTEC